MRSGTEARLVDSCAAQVRADVAGLKADIEHHDVNRHLSFIARQLLCEVVDVHSDCIIDRAQQLDAGIRYLEEMGTQIIVVGNPHDVSLFH